MFSQFWGLGLGFFHPPTSLIPRVVRKLAEDRARGVLVVPKWEEAWWYNSIKEAVRANDLVLAFDMWPVFEVPEWWEGRNFRGRMSFPLSIFVSKA